MGRDTRKVDLMYVSQRVATFVLVTLSVCVQHKHAANIGGGDMVDTMNKLRVDTSTTESSLFFHGEGQTNLTIQAGATAVLHCVVNQLAENTTVSWLKKNGEKLNLVSVGNEVYSGDSRYTVGLEQGDWQLHVHAANLTDHGQYECQVSSHPPVHHLVFLNVIVPQTEIADERNLPIKNKFYNSGSTIELRCNISKVPQPTQFIIWRHNNTILNYDTTRGGISVKTDITSDGARSLLYIANVGPSDSGTYTCSLGDIAFTSVAVVVITGETPAAMQHGGAARPTFLSWACALLTAVSVVRTR